MAGADPKRSATGKNSPGGVISIRSVDPTDRLEAKLQGGYEFNAHEFRGEGFISGPIADGLSSVQEMGEKIFRLVLDTASGRKSKSEELGFGDDEFTPWVIGATM